MSTRLERLEQVERTVKDYVKAEKQRIENEVQVLEAVLKGRTGGAGVQSNSTGAVVALATSDLATFLNEV